MVKRVLIHKRNPCSESSGSSSSDSSSDDEPPVLVSGRYLEADIAFGLQHRDLRLAAVLELQEILDQGLYSSASKKLQQAIYEDLLVAAQQRDSRARVRQALGALLVSARRVLAQKQRQQLAKVERQAAVAASRAARKEAAGTSSSYAAGAAAAAAAGGDEDCAELDDGGSDDDCCPVVFSDVPLEVVGVILQHLDPISLAAAACVCRSWYQLATADSCWRQHLQLVFGTRTTAKLPGRHHQQHQQQQQQRQQQHQPGAQSNRAPAVGPSSSSGAPSRPDNRAVGGGAAAHAGVAAVGAAGAGAAAAAVHAAGAGYGAGAGLCQAADGNLYRLFGSKARKHPTALVRWKSCRALLPWGPLEWCLPATAATAAATAAHVAADPLLCGGLCDPLVVGGAAHRGQHSSELWPLMGVAGAARKAVRAARNQQLPHQYAGPLPRGMPTPLTPAQVVRWMLGMNGYAVTRTEDPDSSGSSSSGSGSDDDSGSQGEESHAATHAALRLWSIGRR